MKTKMTHAERDRTLFAEKGQFIYDMGVVTPDEWATMMFEMGCKFAKNYCLMCMGGSKKAEKYMLESPPKAGHKYNFFWEWWTAQWKIDDVEYADLLRLYLCQWIKGEVSNNRSKIPSYVAQKHYMRSNDLLVNGFDYLYGREILAEVSKVDSPQLVSSI
jgi:hypothetical protein